MFFMKENVLIVTLFSVFVNDKFCTDAFIHDKFPIVLISAKYSSNSVYTEKLHEQLINYTHSNN